MKHLLIFALLIFALLLLPLFSNGQRVDYSGSHVTSVSHTGEMVETTKGKKGYLIFSDTAIVYFLAEGDFCSKPYKDIKEVLLVSEGLNNSTHYYISPTEYFIRDKHNILYVRKVGISWIYETLKL